MKRVIIPYSPKLKLLARKLRNNSIKSEVKLWLIKLGEVINCSTDAFSISKTIEEDFNFLLK